MYQLIHRISNNKLIFKLLDNYKKSAVNSNYNKYIESYTADKQEINYTITGPIYPYKSFLKYLEYKNEEWEIVKKRFHDRHLKFFDIPIGTIDNFCSDNKIAINGNNLYFNSKGLKDDWIYLYLSNNSIRNYVLDFDVVLKSKFRELQFGFRYLDFYNRYRFRIEDNFLHFDIVKKGQFYNSICKEPLELNLDESYNFTIVIKDNKYSFESNGNILMTVTDNYNLFTSGAVAFILWDDSGNSTIQGSFNNIRFDYIS